MEICSGVSSWCAIPRARPAVKLGFCSSSCLRYNPSLLNKTRISVNTATKQSRKKGFTCNALFGLGVPELVVIAGVAALVFGPKKLPEVGRTFGQTVKSFQKAAKEFESELKKEPDSTEGPPSETPVAVSEQEKKDIEVSSSKESV